jgi:hypothetical protein
MVIGHHISINLENDFKIISSIKNNWLLLARITIMLLLEISQTDSRIYALGSKGINKINSDKGKEKKISIIIMINQIIGLTAAQSNRV